MRLEFFGNFFTEFFILRHDDANLEKVDHNKALVYSVAVGILTLGIVHGICAIVKWCGKPADMEDHQIKKTDKVGRRSIPGATENWTETQDNGQREIEGTTGRVAGEVVEREEAEEITVSFPPLSFPPDEVTEEDWYQEETILEEVKLENEGEWEDPAAFLIIEEGGVWEEPVFDMLDLGEEEIMPQFSGTNPIWYDAQLFQDIEAYNSDQMGGQNPEETLGRIKEVIATEEYSLTHRDEVISGIKDPLVQRALRIEFNLLKNEDLVCSFSQGTVRGNIGEWRVQEGEGINACATICAEAIQYLAQGKTIDSEETMRTLILQGIKAHGSQQAKFFDEEVMKEINEKRDIESQFVVEPYLDLDVGMRGALSKASDAQNYLVLTFANNFQNETLMAYYPEKGKPVLFDSHGKNYLGVSKGASLRQFENNEALLLHLNANYVEKGFGASFFTVTSPLNP